MRQLFLPACFCLLTLSNTTGSDLPVEALAGTSSFEKKLLADANEATARARNANEVPANENAFAVAPLPADLPPPPAEVAPELRAAVDEQNVPLPPVPKPVVRHSRQDICDTLAKAALTNNLPLPFFIRLLFQESGFKPGIVSRAGAQGIAQFMPETAASEGLSNPFDPLEAIPASARLLRKLFAQFGNLGLAAAAYNAGPKRIQDWLAKKVKLPQETQGYVRTVTGRPAESWRAANAGGTPLSVPRNAPCRETVPDAPAPQTVVATAASRGRAKPARHVASAKSGKPARHKAPIQQLAARNRKNAHKHQKLAQR